jgi:hypothetical protein
MPSTFTVQRPPEWSAPTHDPADMPGLKAVRIRDGSGRVITTFEGRPSAWMDFFKSPSRKVLGINNR